MGGGGDGEGGKGVETGRGPEEDRAGGILRNRGRSRGGRMEGS